MYRNSVTTNKPGVNFELGHLQGLKLRTNSAFLVGEYLKDLPACAHLWHICGILKKGTISTLPLEKCPKYLLVHRYFYVQWPGRQSVISIHAFWHLRSVLHVRLWYIPFLQIATPCQVVRTWIVLSEFVVCLLTHIHHSLGGLVQHSGKF